VHHQGKRGPVIEKEIRSFSVKDIISEEGRHYRAPDPEGAPPASENLPVTGKEAFSVEEFMKTWSEFVESIKGDGTRIVSMFKLIKPEVEEDQQIKLHLSNAAQKDLFVQNYKQKLIGFLEERFVESDIDIETVVDMSESIDILYSDDQKYNHLASKYPVLIEIKRNFDLDFI
jgi:DNA polymerase-3 subunit gamma/tau